MQQYWNIYPVAEQSLKDAFCKNCAIKRLQSYLGKAGLRTAKEPAQDKLSTIIELTKPTLHMQLSPTLAQEPIAIMNIIAYAPIQKLIWWIEGLFAMNEAINQLGH